MVGWLEGLVSSTTIFTCDSSLFDDFDDFSHGKRLFLSFSRPSLRAWGSPKEARRRLVLRVVSRIRLSSSSGLQFGHSLKRRVFFVYPVISLSDQDLAQLD